MKEYQCAQGESGLGPSQRGHGGSGYWLTPGSFTGFSTVVPMNVSVCIGWTSPKADAVPRRRFHGALSAYCAIGAAVALTFFKSEKPPLSSKSVSCVVVGAPSLPMMHLTLPSH